MPDSLVQRGLRRIMVLTGTLVCLGLAGAAVVIGSQLLAARVDQTPPAAPAALTPVAVRTVEFEDRYTTTRRFLGQIEPASEVILSFELAGRLAELSADEGETVQNGDVVARLDTALLRADRQRTQAARSAVVAQLDFAKSRLERAQRLKTEGFSSQETLDQARTTYNELLARLAETDATLLSIDIQLEKSVLRAPFGGRIGARSADIAETLAGGQPVLTLVKTEHPQLRVGVPLTVSPADLQQTSVEIAGQVYAAQLDQIRPDIDPVTRTRTALFSLDLPGDVAFGQTAALVLEVSVMARGVWLPVDALQQGSGSVWTVFMVDGDIVRPAAVEVLHQNGGQAYVQGTFPPGALFIHSGAHRVVSGQEVSVLMDKGLGS